MANVTITFNATAGVASRSGPELSVQKENRLITYIYQNYGPRGADGSLLPQTNGRVVIAFNAWADERLAELRRSIIDWEQERDARAAREAVADF